MGGSSNPQNLKPGWRLEEKQGEWGGWGSSRRQPQPSPDGRGSKEEKLGEGEKEGVGRADYCGEPKWKFFHKLVIKTIGWIDHNGPWFCSSPNLNHETSIMHSLISFETFFRNRRAPTLLSLCRRATNKPSHTSTPLFFSSWQWLSLPPIYRLISSPLSRQWQRLDATCVLHLRSHLSPGIMSYCCIFKSWIPSHHTF